MKRLSLYILSAIFILLLAACSAPASRENSVAVYRASSYDAQTGGELLSVEYVPVKSGESALNTAATALISGNTFPKGIELKSLSLDSGELKLEMNEAYLNLSGMKRTICEYCAVCTFCELAEVDAVSFYVGDTAVKRGLTENDVILFDPNSDPGETQIRLYFARAGSGLLNMEYHSISVEDDTLLERAVVEELLRGPFSAELYLPFTEGISLISIYTEDGVCTVNLSGELDAAAFSSATAERLAVYSLVNSLTAISGVDRVRILSDGHIPNGFSRIPLSMPVSRNEYIIGPANPARGELEALMCRSDGSTLSALPCLVTLSEDKSLESSLITALIKLPGEAGFSTMFTESDAPLLIQEQDMSITVIMPETFLTSRSTSEASAAADAIAATLAENGCRTPLCIEVRDSSKKRTTFAEYDLTDAELRNQLS